MRQTNGDERTYVDGNSLLQQISSQTYTLDNLFDDCEQRGQQLLQDHADGRMSALTVTLDSISFSDGQRLGRRATYVSAFRAMTSELEEAASTLVPLSVPGLGTFGFRLFNLGISIPFFDLNPKFADGYKLSRPSKSVTARTDSKNQPMLQRLNLQRCAKLAKMPQPLVRDVLACLWRRLGRVMSTVSFFFFLSFIA
jgi:hypothetical protein